MGGKGLHSLLVSVYSHAPLALPASPPAPTLPPMGLLSCPNCPFTLQMMPSVKRPTRGLSATLARPATRSSKVLPPTSANHHWPLMAGV